MNHIFVDFENVSKIDDSVIGEKSVSFYLFVGEKQKKLDIQVVEKLIHHADSVQLIRLTGSGKNALDFTLAYYVGRAAITDPTGCFHIISGDKGYKPLIDHLRSRQIKAYLHPDFTTLTFSCPPKSGPIPAAPDPLQAPPQKAPSKPANPSSSKPLLDRALEHLRKNLSNRPKRKTTLLSHLKATLGNQLTDSDIKTLVNQLKQKKCVEIDEKDKVIYHLST